MLKRFARRITINFRQSKSDRSANQSYGNYNHRIKRILANIIPFRKISQNSKFKDQK